MPLPDRAKSILPLLTKAPELASGNIILVGYSLGGLVIKEVLRLAHDERASSLATGSFLRRVRRVAFIATPHLGSDQASAATSAARRLMTDPVIALPRNDPQLRALQHWYRNFAEAAQLEHLVFYEMKESLFPLRVPVLNLIIKLNVGIIVKPDSADPGFTRSETIPADYDHWTIVQPLSQGTDVFIHLNEFVHREIPDTEPPAGPQWPPPGPAPTEDPATTAAVVARTTELRKSRHAAGFDSLEACTRFFRELTAGSFVNASDDSKRLAAAWCARIVVSKDPALATEMWTWAKARGDGDEIDIAAAYLTLFRDKDRSGALAQMRVLESPLGRSAGMIAASQDAGPEAAENWMIEAGIEFGDLDPDGKYVFLQKCIQREQWDRAVALVQTLLDVDFDHTPALLVTAGAILLASTVPGEFRLGAITYLPLELSELPMSGDAGSVETRRGARELFDRGRAAFDALHVDRMANFASDYALWIGLLDATTKDIAMRQLQESMSDERHALRRLPMALEFSLKLDLVAVEAEIDRQAAVSGPTSPDAAVARFALAKTKGTPAKVAAYIARYREELIEFYQPEWVTSVEIELLARSGQTEAARARLQAVGPEFPAPAIATLSRLIDEAEGADPEVLRERQFTSSERLGDLVVLVDVLKARGSWAKLANYGKLLFDRTGDAASFEAYVTALHQTGENRRVIALAGEFPEMFLSQELQSTLAWSLFCNGNLAEAGRVLAPLLRARNDDNDRTLAMNIAVVSGDWNTLGVLVEEDWAKRDTRGAVDLLHAGQLAQHIGSARSRELIKAAAEKANGDPAILTAAYSAATTEGWENDPAVYAWLDMAMRASGDDGPVKRVDIRELLAMQPDWNERENNTWTELAAGRLPVFGAAHILRRSLLGMFLVQALSNSDQPDPRKRGIVFAYSGARQSRPISANTVALDASAILTLGFLGLLGNAIECFGTVLISHNLLAWLFEERQRVQFHQPSQIRRARELKRLMDTGRVTRFESSDGVSPSLEHEVGDELALFLTAAMSSEGADQKLVVRPYPIHRPGTLMDEIANVSGYEDHLVGCADLVEALQERGQLTAAEEDRARTYLAAQERAWPHKTPVRAGATLYLDDVAVSFLQHLSLLEKLAAAGFKLIVSPFIVQNGNDLVQHEAVADRAREVIEDIRASIAGALTSGKVRLGPLKKLQDEPLVEHPTSNFFDLASSVDALIIDDRFFNRHLNVDAGGTLTPICTVLDVLETLRTRGAISEAQHSEHITKLRRAGFMLVPILEAELTRALARAPVADGTVVETAELRAIRESVTRVRMTDLVQLPLEHVWLDGMHLALTAAIRSQWVADVDDNVARAKSSWLLALFDIRGWAHRTLPEAGDPNAKYRAQILILTGLPDSEPMDRTRYWAWLESAVLGRFKDEDPQSYEKLIEAVQHVIAETIRAQMARGEAT